MRMFFGCLSQGLLAMIGCIMSRIHSSVAAGLSLFCISFHVQAAELSPQADQWIETIRMVGKEGQGNAEAKEAMQQLMGQSVDAVVPILKGMQGSSPLVKNWLRSAVETIVDRSSQDSIQLPLMPLTDFLLDESNDARARAMAFELIEQHDPHAGEMLLRGMLNDPSNDLRRLAVRQWIDAGTKALSGEPATAKVVFRQALQYARDIEQIRLLADELEKMDQPVHIPRLLGFITDWRVIGPFHNLDRTGFDTVFPPEKSLDFKATYTGKSGDVSWSVLESEDRFGMVDVNKAYPGLLKEVTAYAHHAFYSDTDRTAQLRLGTKNAWKVWFNGELLFGRDEYHRMAKVDQYILDVQLKAGKNDILIKLCQNEQLENWTVEWEFQLRVSDETGKAIHSLAR